MFLLHKILEASSGVMLESIMMTDDSTLPMSSFECFSAVKCKTSSAVWFSTTSRSAALLMFLKDFFVDYGLPALIVIVFALTYERTDVSCVDMMVVC